MPRTSIIDRTPFYAAAGAAEVAVEALRGLPSKLSEAMSQAPSKASELPERLSQLAAKAGRETAQTYRELATRGEVVVERLRSHPPE